MDLFRCADVVPRAFDGQVDVLCEANADAGVDLRPVPPDARRRILSAEAFEAVVQFAPADSGLDALQQRLAAGRRATRPAELIAKLRLGAAAVHARHRLACE